jgi:hypothetical protein
MRYTVPLRWIEEAEARRVRTVFEHAQCVTAAKKSRTNQPGQVLRGEQKGRERNPLAEGLLSQAGTALQ